MSHGKSHAGCMIHDPVVFNLYSPRIYISQRLHLGRRTPVGQFLELAYLRSKVKYSLVKVLIYFVRLCSRATRLQMEAQMAALKAELHEQQAWANADADEQLRLFGADCSYILFIFTCHRTNPLGIHALVFQLGVLIIWSNMYVRSCDILESYGLFGRHCMYRGPISAHVTSFDFTCTRMVTLTRSVFISRLLLSSFAERGTNNSVNRAILHVGTHQTL